MIDSGRLVLRGWRDEDRIPFAAMSADPRVMRHLLPLVSRSDADDWIDREISHLDAHGFCFWAVVSKVSGALVGAAGLRRINYAAHFTPTVEIGYRLAHSYWGQGFATEAAQAIADFAFDQIGLYEIVATAGKANAASCRVMTRIGMKHDPAEDFDHPLVPEGNALKRQSLYRMSRDAWISKKSAI